MARVDTAHGFEAHMGNTLNAAKHWQEVATAEVDGRVATTEGDDAEALAMEAWAECMMARGVERRLALQCAAAIWDLQRTRDAACAGSAVAWVGPVPERAELVEGVRTIGIKIYQAAKRGMEAGALVLATGSTHPDFGSARELAEKVGVSHELAANAVEEWQRCLHLPTTSGQKSEAAKQTYRDTNGKLGRKAA